MSGGICLIADGVTVALAGSARIGSRTLPGWTSTYHFTGLGAPA